MGSTHSFIQAATTFASVASQAVHHDRYREIKAAQHVDAEAQKLMEPT